ncbi:Uncharacterised protein [Candidatus Anstonella stagnisolia]|nr:Uncharacterised protein [Candidatus Anstonella stagnisolia]
MAKYRSRRKKPVGKRIVYVTPHYEAAREVAAKYERAGSAAAIEKDYDETGRLMYVVYVL